MRCLKFYKCQNNFWTICPEVSLSFDYGSWQETWGFWAYEKRQNMMRVELAKDYLTGEYIDANTAWNEFHNLEKIEKRYKVTYNNLNKSTQENNTIESLAPAPEIALSQLRSIANSESSILGGKASGEYDIKRRMENITVQTGVYTSTTSRLFQQTQTAKQSMYCSIRVQLIYRYVQYPIRLIGQ